MMTTEAASRAMAAAVQICRQEGLSFDDTVDLCRYYGVELALRNNRENQIKAAEELHRHRNTLSRMMGELGVPKVTKSAKLRRKAVAAAQQLQRIDAYLHGPRKQAQA